MTPKKVSVLLFVEVFEKSEEFHQASSGIFHFL